MPLARARENDERELPPLHVQFDYGAAARVKTAPPPAPTIPYSNIFRWLRGIMRRRLVPRGTCKKNILPGDIASDTVFLASL